MSAAGYVVFRVGERRLATALDEVREIVRLDGLADLPGMRPPLAGFLVLRGAPLPVLDVRAAPDAGADRRGDVLVLDVDGGPVGVAVDAVEAVAGEADLPEGDPPARTLPSYVVGVRRGAGGPVLLVDLHLLLDATAAGWSQALTA